MTTIATLFSGGEGVGVGARAAGLTHLWGIEYRDDIANVARSNGFHVITADVMSIDPATLEVPDILHASPVCKRASNANQSAELNEDGTKEAMEDIGMGEKVAEFIDIMRPRCFTLENVFAYRNFKAFKIICNALDRGGYMWDFDNINAADYFVPQTRRRLILRAVRGALLPMLPQPERWIGWYSAILDLIPTLPESRFAAWQLARLPSDQSARAGESVQVIGVDEPSFPIRAGENGGGYPKAYLVDGQNSRTKEKGGLSTYNENEPAMTINSAMHGLPRAWLSQGRVVSMTPQALARFQSFPDDYILPDNKKLACTIIGNSVPPLLYQKIIAPLAEVIR